MARVYDDVMTISEYMEHIGIDNETYSDINPANIKTIDELRDTIATVADCNRYTSIWDYPLDEIEYVIQDTDLHVALVTNGEEYRWFEIPQ